MPKYYKNGGLKENWLALYLAIKGIKNNKNGRKKYMTGTEAIAAMHLKITSYEKLESELKEYENKGTARKAEKTRQLHHKE